jgi:hypothetical protein
MSLKEKVEENVVLWLLGMLITGFLSGIGAYKAILEIAQLTVVPKSAEVVGLSREVERLKAENQKLRGKEEERVATDRQTELGVETPNMQAAETEKGGRSEVQAEDTSIPLVKIEPGLPEKKFSGTIVLKNGDETECLEMSFRDMLKVFQYWWDPEKVGSLVEMPFGDIRSLQPGSLRKVGNISPDFIEVRLERVDGKAIDVYTLSNYAFYCNEKNLPHPTAFPITQAKIIKFSLERRTRSKGEKTLSATTPSKVLPALFHQSTSLGTAEMISELKRERLQWTGTVAEVRSGPNGETIIDLIHDVDQRLAAASFSKDEMLWWTSRWKDTELYLDETQKKAALSLNKGDSLKYSGIIDSRILTNPVCCLVIKNGSIISRGGSLK